MARTISEIYDDLIDEKEAQPQLNALVPNPDAVQDFLADLTSTSKVAVWRLFLWTVAVGIWVHENIFDAHKVEIVDLVNVLIPGTDRWYRAKSFEFQNGDQLSLEDVIIAGVTYERFIYSPVTPVNQIVKRASVIKSIDINGIVIVLIKVAKLDVSDNPIALSVSEKNSFGAFMELIKFAGTNLTVISQAGDDMHVQYKIYYDPLVLSANGSLISDGTIFPIEDAINGYIEDLPFDGVLSLVELTDAVQGASGVVDPFLQLAEARAGAAAYQAITEFYQAEAGYMVIGSGFPLSNELTYIVAP